MLKDEGVTSSRPSIEPVICFAIAIVASKIEVIMDCPFAGAAQRNEPFVTKNSYRTEHDRLLVEVNCYKIENKL